ncbi:MAG: CoA transferase [Chloroflexi bacterium]|nr:CoA transferase [Chloroflexota bacterium]
MAASPLSSARGAGEGLLAGCRVLDLTYERGHLCGRLLGDLGADVIKVEPPQGDPARHQGPFYHSVPDLNTSLYWWAFNYNKRGITLDIATADGRMLLRDLVARTDIVLESYQPGYLDSLGLGYEQLRAWNPGVILTSLSPFGQEGPYAQYATSDLVLMGIGGILFHIGDTDRPPGGFPMEQAFHLGATEAVVGALIAYYARETTGQGQHVDVSVQQSVNATGGGSPVRWQRTGEIALRPGQFQKGIHPAVPLRIVYPCKDGYVAFRLLGGPMGVAINRALVAWMREEGMAEDWLDEIGRDDWPFLSLGVEEIRKVEAAIGRFFLTHTKQELYEGSIQRRVFLYAVSSFQDIAESPQLAARSYWREVSHPELNETLRYPGPFAQLSETALNPDPRRRAPLLGEHNSEVYGDLLGLSQQDILLLRQAGVI